MNVPSKIVGVLLEDDDIDIDVQSLVADSHIERWAFTHAEALDPRKCFSTDQFAIYSNSLGAEIIIQRNGEFINQAKDGVGNLFDHVVTEEDKKDLSGLTWKEDVEIGGEFATEEELDAQEARWYHVYVGFDGEFVSFDESDRYMYNSPW
jgi:hypothetical protein